jgi:acetylcholinesterase
MLAHPNTAAPFQAAILESGSPGGVPIDPITAKDAQYNRVLLAAGCQTASDHLSCLRAVPWKEIRRLSLQESARASQPATYARGFYSWTGVIDGGPDKGGFYTSSPSAVISSGAYARVPILQGNCLDEGTYFAPHTFNNQADLSTWLRAVYFTNPNSSPTESTALINQVLDAYPDDPRAGSPYHAAGSSPTDRFFGPTNQFKRAASIYGDIRFQSDRRLWLSAFTNNNENKAYSYIYAQDSPRDSPSVGVPHGSDLAAVLQNPSNPISETMARQFLAFATSHDPSASPGLPAWPAYTTAQPTLLQYENGAIKQISDNFRSGAIDLLNSQEVLKITGR